MWSGLVRVFGGLALAFGLCSAALADASCEALNDLGVLATLDAAQATRNLGVDAARMRDIIRKAAGAGQLSPFESAAFERYLAQRASGAPTRFPLSTSEIRRRHSLCMEQAGSTANTAPDKETPAQVSARHGLPAAPPVAPPAKSRAPIIDAAPDIWLDAETLRQLRFVLAVLLAVLLIAIITIRWRRIAGQRLRRGKRHLCNIPAAFDVDAKPNMGRVIDLSGLGCKLDTYGTPLAEGQAVQLRMLDLRLDTRVVWSNQSYAGLVFDESLPSDQVKTLLETASIGKRPLWPSPQKLTA